MIWASASRRTPPYKSTICQRFAHNWRSVVVLQRNHPGQARRRRSKRFRVPRLTSWVHSVARQNFVGYPIYVRGEAYLAGGQGNEAAAEFQKILDHPGVVLNGLIGALAHLGLGRAYALEAQSMQGAEADGARAKARTAYNDFLTLWKDADPDIPILKQAKAEYAKLQ